jgi:tRNA (guanine6-N2)-methyltransferase
MRFDFLARCIRGIEWIVAAEVEETLDVGAVSLGHREVRFSTGTLPSAKSLQLASADDAFLVLGEAGGVDHTRASLARLTEAARDLPWTDALSNVKRIRPSVEWSAFTISASFLGRRNYNRYEIEDHVAEAAAAALKLPYRATRDDTPAGLELSLRVHVVEGRATFALRVFDTPLHRRRYKQRSHIGTLHPPLAAAMAMVAGLRPGATVLDPFAGAGTVAIESNLLQPSAIVIGTDIDHERLADAGVNARAAGVGAALLVADAVRLPFPYGGFDRVVTNVPWQVAVEVEGDLARSPEARDRELARVLEGGGRAVLLVNEDDPVRLGTAGDLGLALCHRSWLSVSGQHPRLCILAREDAVGAGPIDTDAPFGRALARNLPHAGTMEFSMAQGTG